MPVHPFAVGVIVTVAVIGVTPELVAVNPGISPVPLAPRHMAMLLLDHVNVDPVTGPVTGVTGTTTPLQYPWLAMVVTVGVGYTTIV